jgi:hypothetical protein
MRNCYRFKNEYSQWNYLVIVGQLLFLSVKMNCINIINKYCNTNLGLKYMFKASDCSVREICTVLQCIMFAISYNIRLMESTWSQCLCPFHLSVTRHILTKICYTGSLFEGPIPRDPGATPVI